MSKTILVVAAHADDEVLGCGGTMARHAAAGDSVHVVFVADGVSSRLGSGIEDMVLRKKAIERACTILGVTSSTMFGLPDNKLDSIPLLDIVQPLESICAKLEPDVVYTHHYGDLNVDHRLTHQAVMTALRPLPGSKVKEIYAFEVVSSTDWSGPSMPPFVPQLSIDISNYLDSKMMALESYQMEMRPTPHSRSLENIKLLALHRGYTIGFHAAEAFMVLRVLR